MLRRIKETDSYLQTLVNNMPGVAYRCLPDDDYTMVYISEQIEEITGYSNREFINNKRRSFRSIIHPDDDALLWEDVDRYFSYSPFILRFRLINSAGKNVHIESRGQGVFDDNKNLLYIDGILMDVTESHSLLREISDQNKQLKELAYRQSHVLRAPLARLMGMVNLMELNYSEDEWTKWLHQIKISANELDSLLCGIKNSDVS